VSALKAKAGSANGMRRTRGCGRDLWRSSSNLPGSLICALEVAGQLPGRLGKIYLKGFSPRIRSIALRQIRFDLARGQGFLCTSFFAPERKMTYKRSLVLRPRWQLHGQAATPLPQAVEKHGCG
jgi:hypothetical protein